MFLDEVEVRQLWILVTPKGSEIVGTATHLTTHGSLFPFNDKWTTLMFFVASDLNVARKEKLTSSLSLNGEWMSLLSTLDAVQTLFVELFCAPKSSVENPSLRVSGHGGSMSRTKWTVGCWRSNWWAKAILMMKNRVFGHGTTTCNLGSPDRSQVVKWREEKIKERKKGKCGFKRIGKAFLVKNKHKTLKKWSEENMLGSPKVNEARKFIQKARKVLREVVFALIIQKQVQAMNSTCKEIKAAIKKKK